MSRVFSARADWRCLRNRPKQRKNRAVQADPFSHDQGTNGMGRLTGVQFVGNDWFPTTFNYTYSYNRAGRVISQGMTMLGQNSPGNFCRPDKTW